MLFHLIFTVLMSLIVIVLLLQINQRLVHGYLVVIAIVSFAMPAIFVEMQKLKKYRSLLNLLILSSCSKINGPWDEVQIVNNQINS